MKNARFSVLTQKGEIFRGEFTLTSPFKKTVDDWIFQFKAPYEIETFDGVELLSREGNIYTVRSNRKNRRLAPGKSQVVRFRAKTNNLTSVQILNRTKARELSISADFFASSASYSPTYNSQAQPPQNQAGQNAAQQSQLSTRFNIKSSWQKGFVGQIFFTPQQANRSAQKWELTFEAPFKITKIWNGDILKRQGNRYTIGNDSWNGQLKAGQQVSFGFVADTSQVGSSALNRNRPTEYSLRQILPASPAAPLTTPPTTTPDNPQQNAIRYGEALQKSFLFYEAQRAGKLPKNNRIDWRGDSVLSDGKDVGLDLSGGYFDAGDAVKFGMTISASMTLLAWGAVEYRQAYQRSKQLDDVMDAIKWGTDYIMKAHVTENGKTKAFYGQVGLGKIDHKYVGAVEDMPKLYRPALKIDADNPGSDLAGESAAALASAAVVFKKTRPAYAKQLIRHAKQLFEFAKAHTGKYSESIPEAHNYHRSRDTSQDELAWAATWLYKATGEQRYLNEAETLYDGIAYTHDLSHKNLGTSVLLSQIKPGRARYHNDAKVWLNRWADGTGGVKYTPGGFAWLIDWGSSRATSTAAFIASVYSNRRTDPTEKYAEFAESQVDYLLGENPANFSYMVGFGDNYPKQPHHRNATGTPNFRTPQDNRHILYGAMVGGLTKPNDFAYQDLRRDYVSNEPALMYNAGMTGAIAYMYDQYGGAPLSNAQLDALPGISVPGF